MKTAIVSLARVSLCLVLIFLARPLQAASLKDILPDSEIRPGLIAVIHPPGTDNNLLMDVVKNGEALWYVQTATHNEADALRRQAEAAGLLGRGLFVDFGPRNSIGLGANLADTVLCPGEPPEEAELLRILRPLGTAYTAGDRIVKPVPPGIDEWTHPYHGPDNNPQSNDQLARGSFQTQFLGYPLFSPMPQQSVIAGGRIFKAFGHIAHKANQNEVLNTLMGVNAYNGMILWRRPLPEGFMIHRNTMIATGDSLLLGDDESCKVYDAATGEVRDEITVPEELTDGPVWKWMGLRQGVLYALAGHKEVKVETQPSERRGLGHWPWGMWQGHDYKDPRTAFGFGRTLLAIDLKTQKVLWHYRTEGYLDARGICMNDDRIFAYSPDQFLLCLDASNGDVVWKTAEPALLEAIGPNERAQHYITGYATSCYVKADSKHLFFAGPQRRRLVAVSTSDGSLSWTHSPGNLQLVIRPDAVYAAGPQNGEGYKLDHDTGRVLAQLPGRRACTRATGTIDSIFFRASGGTVRVLTADDSAHHIAPMRPSCQDGVLISNGHLYWSPWMCGCQLSLYGHIALGPLPGNSERHDAEHIYADALKTYAGAHRVRSLDPSSGDWPSYRADNGRSDGAPADLPLRVRPRWQVPATEASLLTAPVVDGGLVFVADDAGAVRALDRDGNLSWKAYAGGAVYFPPAIAHDRAYVGAADGLVYAYEAATGRLLWTFRVAPARERIPVYGRLASRWPVAGGVVVDGETVYAAAGIAHYDGTYVVALDAITGQLKAANTTSGNLAPEVSGGISLQGELTIQDGELRFLGGGVYEVARYNLETLECLNTPKNQIYSQYHTAFYPYFPEYGKYLSLDYACVDGSRLTHDASYEGSRFSSLALEPPLPADAKKPRKDKARWNVSPRANRLRPLWEDKANRRFTSFMVSPERLLAAGHPAANPGTPFLALIDVRTGADLWSEPLPAVPVRGGTAMAQGRIYATLENGLLVCFESFD